MPFHNKRNLKIPGKWLFNWMERWMDGWVNESLQTTERATQLSSGTPRVQTVPLWWYRQVLFAVLLLYYQRDLEHSLGVWLPARIRHQCISYVFTFIHYVLNMLPHPQVSQSTPGSSHKQFFCQALPLTDSTHPLSPSLCILPWESIRFCFLWSESLSYLLATHMLKLNLQCDCAKLWGFQEAIRPWGQSFHE